MNTPTPRRGAVRIAVLADAATVAEAAATFISEAARAAVAARGRCVLAVSGGRAPWVMLRALATRDVPWPSMELVQVDERVAPGRRSGPQSHALAREPARATRRCRADQVHAMPVDAAGSRRRRAANTRKRCARDRGHAADTRSRAPRTRCPTATPRRCVPGDPVLAVTAADVALAGPYQGRMRMTLTYPMLERARELLWVVTGADKAAMLAAARRRRHRRFRPDGLRHGNMRVLADHAAAGPLALHLRESPPATTRGARRPPDR